MMAVDYKRYAILFVDDDAAVRKTFRYMFGERFAVLTASGGKQALKLLAREPVSVLLADQRMPELTGVELCARAKELQPRLQTMIVTAYADVSEAIAAINRGQVSAYIPKPWTEVQMVQALETCIDRLRAGASAHGIAVEMLSMGPEQIKAAVLDEVAHEVLHPLFASKIHHDKMLSLTVEALSKLNGDEASEARLLIAQVLEHQRGSAIALNLIEAIVERYRPSAHATSLQRCEVAEVVEDVVTFVRPVSWMSEIEVIVRSSPAVYMERSSLARVVLNLLLNASQSMKAKSLELDSASTPPPPLSGIRLRSKSQRRLSARSCESATPV